MYVRKDLPFLLCILDEWVLQRGLPVGEGGNGSSWPCSSIRFTAFDWVNLRSGQWEGFPSCYLLFLFWSKESQGFKKMMLDLEDKKWVLCLFHRPLKYRDFSWSWKMTSRIQPMVGLRASAWRG